jgi:hypothetical protein
MALAPADAAKRRRIGAHANPPSSPSTQTMGMGQLGSLRLSSARTLQHERLSPPGRQASVLGQAQS